MDAALLTRRESFLTLAASAFPRTIGRTHLSVTPIGLGCERASADLIRRAADLGITYFHNVGPRPSATTVDYEKVAAGLDGGRRRRVVLSTGTSALDAAGMEADVDSQLRRLATDYLDIWILQAVDRLDQLTDERVDSARRLQREGKFRVLAVSTHQP